MARRKSIPAGSKKPTAGRGPLPAEETPYEILNNVRSGEISEKQLRSEYTKLRDRARKQLDRFVKKGYEVPKEYRFFSKDRGEDSFWKLSELRDTREIAFAMADLQRFISSKETNVRGRIEIDKKIVETLRSHGYDGIDMSNVKEFGKFMKKMEDRYHSKKYYPSADLAQFFSDRKSVGRGVPVSKSGLRKAFKKWQQENAI